MKLKSEIDKLSPIELTQVGKSDSQERESFGVSTRDTFNLDSHILEVLHNSLIFYVKNDLEVHGESKVISEALEVIEKIRYLLKDFEDEDMKTYHEFVNDSGFEKGPEDAHSLLKIDWKYETAELDYRKASHELAEKKKSIIKDIFAWMGENLEGLWV